MKFADWVGDYSARYNRSFSNNAMRIEPRLHRPIAIVLIIATAIFHLWYASRYDLVQDEAYYWQWSRHLALGYYDNTPLMAFVIHMSTLVFSNNAIGVRFGAILCSALATWLIYVLAEEMFGSTIGLIAVVITNVNPLFGAGAFLMTQDPVQLLFWILCVVVSWRALSSSGASSWLLWTVSGILAGLTAMSKLNGLLILPSVLLFVALDPNFRVWLRRPQPYLAVLIALLIFTPFLWWNHTHENAFWQHINVMGSRTDSSQSKFTLKYFGDFLGAQAGLFSPLLFLTYLWALIKTPKLAGANSALRYCWCLSVVVFVATLLVSLKSRVEGNWAVAAYLTGVILIAYYVVQSWSTFKTSVWHGASIGLATILTILLFGSTLSTHAIRIKALDKKTDELYGWKTLANRVSAEQSAMGDDPFIFGVNYRMPSELAFYLPDQPQTYSLFLRDRANEYMFWEDERKLIGRDAIFVNDTPTPDHLDDIRAVFRRVDVQPPVLIYRAPYKEPIRTLQIFRCYGFKGYDRSKWQVGW